MTISEAYLNLKNELVKIYDEKESANITNLILENITGLNKIDRRLTKATLLTTEQQDKFLKYKSELTNHRPLQYVLNEDWFAGMKFYVDESVLIPRPETEELVEWIIHDFNSLNKKKLIKILDVGTGSGCIAIALKKKIKNADVFAIDISNNALNIAKKNAHQNNTEIHFFLDDILQEKMKNNFPLFDVIVSNPPYIMQKEINEMQKNVIEYEPHTALFVSNENPLLFYDHISQFALHHLNQNGSLYFEIHEELGSEIVALLNNKGFHSTEIKKDMQGKDRMIKAFYKTL